MQFRKYDIWNIYIIFITHYCRDDEKKIRREDMMKLFLTWRFDEIIFDDRISLIEMSKAKANAYICDLISMCI